MLLFVLISLSATLGSSQDDARDQIAKSLTEPILTPGQTRTELDGFVLLRLPDLRVPASAQAWTEESDRIRKNVLDRAILKGVPKAWLDAPLNVQWLDTIDKFEGYTVRKLRYEAIPGLWIPALLYVPSKLEGRVPVVLNVNGHVGEPGKAIDYKQIRCINLAKRGVIALNPEWYGMGELGAKGYGHERLAYLDLTGVSGVSLFYLSMKRGLDVLEVQPNADPNRVAVTGLSGGGWQTIIISSLDKRVTLAAPNAGYIGTPTRMQFSGDVGDLEQVPSDLLSVADYTHLTAIHAPRPTLLLYNANDDCCFQAYRARASVYDPVMPFYSLYGAEERFRFHENFEPGTHNYLLDNRQQFYAFLNWNFGINEPDEEIPSDKEVLTRADLDCGIPQDNETFVSLAEKLSQKLPASQAPNSGTEKYRRWVAKTRAKLSNVLRVDQNIPEVKAAKMAVAVGAGLESATYKFRIGEFTLPAVCIAAKDVNPTAVAIVVADAGKASQTDTIGKLLEGGVRVIAVDPVYFGEASFDPKNDWQYGMFLQSAGGRLLGLEAQELAAIATWARVTFHPKHITLDARGEVLSTAAIIAAGLYPGAVDEYSAPDAPASLKDLIHNDVGYQKHVPMFCFGLLRAADINEMKALSAPRK